ncbi:MAG TPA: universal stress protein [Mycobacteriales bacterium]|nr:universal stress protein [Mycobacteriales bacterium]
MSGIVVGLEDAPDAMSALDWALTEAAERHEPLTVVSVVNDLPVATPGFYASDAAGHVHDVRRSTRSWADRVVKSTVARHRDVAGVSVKVKVVGGSPAKVLTDMSRDASMVVVGRRGSNPVSRLLLGSVSSTVVHHAECPVVVVPEEGSGHEG